MAIKMAAEAGVKFDRTSHPTLPCMGESGCTMPPHFRPLCTLHLCSISSLGTTGDAELDEKYFSLREAFDDEFYAASRNDCV